MITREQKQQIVAELVEKLQKSNGIYLLDFTGLSVQDTIEARREIKKLEAEMKVAKNTLIQRALREAERFTNIPDDRFFGPTAVTFAYGDPIRPVRFIKKLVDDNKIRFKAAVIEDEFFGEEQLAQLASFPTREEIYAGIVGSLQAPLSNVISIFHNLVRDLVSVIDEVAKKQAEAA